MARAYKCDICGGLYAKESTHNTSSKIFLAFYNRRGLINPVDICQDCWDAIKAEIEERRKIKKELVTPSDGEEAAADE